MPDRSALPRSSAPRRVDPERAALLVHDVQNHFVGRFPARQPPVVDLVGNIVALREPAGALGLPVVFGAGPTVQRGLAADVRGPAIGDGPGDAAIIEPLTPRPGEHLLPDARQNAFLRSHLGRPLREEGRDQLVVCGVHARLGVLPTAADAFMNDIQPFVVADAATDHSAEEHETALRRAARSGVVRTTDDLLRGLLLGRNRRDA
ncbi:isochorismatase family protein [Streptomyces sp. NPDC013012]|uniref:isochorismatase family protein n=1 Tax=Streptomyces sp. NPDC013012 TaxID=3364860 RepID=UPI0036CCF299